MTPVPPGRLTRAQVREIDRISIERYGIPGIVLMENAARGAADVAWEMLRSSHQVTSSADQAGAAQRRPGSSDGRSPDVLILCGGGNNGGDGLAVARHLHNRGCGVRVLLTVAPDSYKGDAAVNRDMVRAMGLPSAPFSLEAIGNPVLIVDAVFGTGLTRSPRDPFPELAAAVNATGVPVLAIDLPSGLDCDTGRPIGDACIRATRTVTFVAEKAGFAHPAAAQFAGPITVVDIGCPIELIDEVTTARAPA
jgi:NAD(P)H-hydrate epimerase